MMEEEQYLASIVVVILCVLSAHWWLAAAPKKKSSDDGLEEIPMAPGAIPLLGHALSYRKDPPGFLVNTRKACGPVFQLNLAGKKMILVCGPDQQRQLATQPESILSLRKAVGAIGFEQTLGYKNVHTGTQLHKGIVKAIWNSPEGNGPADAQLQTWKTCIQDAMELEVGNTNDKVDFLHFTRRVILRATIEVFVGKSFLRDWKTYDFMKEFMDFQDTLEDVTAKVVVVPRPLALVGMLWPLQKRREKMQLVMQERLEQVLKESKEDIGFWLKEVLAQDIPTADIAEYIVGLLFAGHKNPAIGAAQSYLLLREHGSKPVQAKCQADAEVLVASSNPKWSEFKSALPTLHRACLESLRLTAHSIGGVRAAQKDLTVSVKKTIYRIPKESSVAFAHITSSLDSDLWGEKAGVFDSDLQRYSDESYHDDYKFTTFSHGVHKCPGRELAMIHLKLTVALLLTEYDVVLPESIPPLDFERATLAQRHAPVMVSISKKR
mmetsp:Transcript_14022/g.35280  ORF Transcript_14022/g.35280 Transcript_14022/m.35280 type:complete len:493 (+) Transcript_14022:34-1512(+)